MNRLILFPLLIALVVLSPACDDETPNTSTDTLTSDTGGTQDTAGGNDTQGEDTHTGDTQAEDTQTGVDTNIGDTTIGDTNIGDTNIADTTLGDTNTGDTNTGDTNTGDTNTGDTNTGGTGETCSDAIDATAGGTFTGDTAAANDDYDSGIGNTGCPSGAATGNDIVYVVSPSDTTTYDVTVVPDGSTFDPMLYVRADCTQDACLAGTVFNGPGEQENTDFTLAGGETAYIIVDGENVSDGSYTLTIDATPEGTTPTGDTCDDAIDVTAGGVLTNQSTVTANDDYETGSNNPGCPVGRATGPDRVYVVSPSATTTYRILVEPNESNFDPMLYARLDCAQDACIDGTVLNGPGTQEQIDITVNGGETAYIIVDGETLSDGTYTLTVTIP